MPAQLITLTTDFGTADGYAGALKGVLLAACPAAQVVDVTHDLAPHDVRAGAVALLAAAPYFPTGTVHLAVVDPGVGTQRRALALGAGGHVFVGPDNGLLLPAVDALGLEWAVALERPGTWRVPVPAATFHGRDVFAPVAARLAAGAHRDALGSPVDAATLVRLPPDRAEGGVGHVVHVDRFGNLVTSLRAEDAPPGASGVTLLGRRLPIVRTYGELPPGGLGALVGSGGYFEIACNGGSAAARLAAGLGPEVRID